VKVPLDLTRTLSRDRLLAMVVASSYVHHILLIRFDAWGNRQDRRIGNAHAAQICADWIKHSAPR
jgi:hypothetical protein